MRAAPRPRLHLFVCANRREGSPLGDGCAERGDALYDALKREVTATRRVAEVWVTKTHCLGICPKHGATVARYSADAQAIVSDVEVEDVPALLAVGGKALPNADDWQVLEDELIAIEELQSKKVLELARRLKPGLTLEDVQNPHDFPELNDPDWHYADGVLTGMKSVSTALRALHVERTRRSGGEDE